MFLLKYLTKLVFNINTGISFIEELIHFLDREFWIQVKVFFCSIMCFFFLPGMIQCDHESIWEHQVFFVRGGFSPLISLGISLLLINLESTWFFFVSDVLQSEKGISTNLNLLTVEKYIVFKLVVLLCLDSLPFLGLLYLTSCFSIIRYKCRYCSFLPSNLYSESKIKAISVTTNCSKHFFGHLEIEQAI